MEVENHKHLRVANLAFWHVYLKESAARGIFTGS
jgi:hypothetical protein